MREDGNSVCTAQQGFSAKVAGLMNVYWFSEAPGTQNYN